jgi:hypothetical protein
MVPGSRERCMKLLVTQLQLFLHNKDCFSQDFNFKFTESDLLWCFYDKDLILWDPGPENAVWSCQWLNYNYSYIIKIAFLRTLILSLQNLIYFDAFIIKSAFYGTQVLRTQYKAASDSTTIIPA